MGSSRVPVSDGELALNLFLNANAEILGLSKGDRQRIETAELSSVTIAQSDAGVPLLRIGMRQMYNPEAPTATVVTEVAGLVGDDDADVVVERVRGG